MLVGLLIFESKNLNHAFRNNPAKNFASAFCMSSKKIEYDKFLPSVVIEVEDTN